MIDCVGSPTHGQYMKSTLSFFAALVCISCGSGALSTAACPTDGTTLTYENFGSSFMSSYCVSCHSGSRAESGIDLSTSSKAQTYAAAIVSEAGTRSKMPPAGSPAPTATERAQLVEWLSCGSQ